MNNEENTNKSSDKYTADDVYDYILGQEVRVRSVDEAEELKKAFDILKGVVEKGKKAHPPPDP